MRAHVIWIATFHILTYIGVTTAAPPIKFSIECEPDGDKLQSTPLLKRSRIPIVPQSEAAPRTLCEELRKSLPEGINEGKFVLTDSSEDALPEGDTQYIVALPPPKDFDPYAQESPSPQPVVEENSAERVEKFKKSVDKMAHFVNVLGHLDNYLTDRARHAVSKLSKIVHE